MFNARGLELESSGVAVRTNTMGGFRLQAFSWLLYKSTLRISGKGQRKSVTTTTDKAALSSAAVGE